MAETLIIIPTYNESENIAKIIPAILKYSKGEVDIAVVDDNSPDGTADVVRNFQKEHENIILINRLKKEGLGKAYVAGFEYALKNGYEFIFEMDADYSHDPKEINNFLKKIKDFDLVIGSRYVQGVRVLNWPLRRLFLSVFANLYTKIITGMPIYDATGGFKCFRRKVLESIDLRKIKSNGYAFQIEMNYKAFKKGFKITEMPIVFVDRIKGHSKMSRKIVWEAAWMVWKLRIKSLFNLL
ncbi:MAG: polyprenol monophosphomannose synthase [Bacteroidetes bacterium]|nr:polyprenol monophosphomannose synthase [Bacteroidota bacterium]